MIFLNRIKTCCLAASAATMAAAPASSSDRILTASPTSVWQAALENEACFLKRSYMISDDDLTLEIRQNVPHQHFEISVTSKTLSKNRLDPQTQFGTAVEPTRHKNWTRLSGGDWSGFKVTVPKEYFALPHELSEEVPLTITRAFHTDFQIPLDLRDPMAVMSECIDTLIASWGLDPDVERNLSRRVVAPKSYRFMSSILRKFPKSHTQPTSRTFGMRLIVGAEGSPIGCSLLDELGESEFEEFACEHAQKHARFEPALDQEGNAVPSFVIINGFVSGS
ncbi:hypothetical protein BPTFM16_02592 [Altererythrobacter insulae]|nr:hypothetical protein BPTFM16_02592 [Altererythrobacter insulae]